MYAFIVRFNDGNKSELLNKLNLFLIHSVLFEHDCIYVETRKIWKLYFFKFYFRKFIHKFCYYEFSAPYKNITAPLFIRKRYDIDISRENGYIKKLSIFFSNINDIWKIRLIMFLKN